MKYIRTKDTEFRNGDIFKVLKEDEDYYECEGTFEKRLGCKTYVKKEIVVKTSDTIEELMMIDDLVIKKNGDIFVIPNQAYIDYYIAHKSVSKLFIKTSKGNYIRVAEENEKGELELL